MNAESVIINVQRLNVGKSDKKNTREIGIFRALLLAFDTAYLLDNGLPKGVFLKYSVACTMPSRPVDLNQVWVNCSKCHKPYSSNSETENGKFWLTSCAHIVCSKHCNGSTTVCPVCGTERVSVLPLDDDSSKLPTEVQSFFKPFTSQLEPLYTVANFQWDSMVQVCGYYRQMCVKLQEKCNRQRELLVQAKEELDKYTALKNELRMGKSATVAPSSGSQTVSRNIFNARNDVSSENHESFVSKLQNSHRLSKPSRSLVNGQEPTSSPSSSSITNILAESTSINKIHQIEDPIVPTTPQTTVMNTSSKSTNSYSKPLSKQGAVSKSLPNALERLKLRRSSTSTISSRGILSYMRINSSQTSTGINSRSNINSSIYSRNQFKK